MKNYKVVFSFQCLNGHTNLAEHRFEATSQEKAEKMVAEMRFDTQCHYCPEQFTRPRSLRIMGTEQIPKYPTYQHFGYICKCGERVSVYKLEIGRSLTPPLEIEASCSKGHKRIVKSSMKELSSLTERWTEEVN